MASNSSNNRNQDDSENRRNARRKQNVELARTAPDSVRGLTHSPNFNGLLYKRMSEDLHLGGMAKRTHEGYLRAVRQLADFCKRSPDQITEDQLREFFLHLKNDKEFASGSLRVAYSGVKFFYTRTCKRKWETLAQMRIKDVKSLPEVLTIDQVDQIISECTTPRMAVFFWTVYSLGLRLEEARNLQVGDVDSKRMMVHIHRGKGAKDRYLPLPESTLFLLRDFWKSHQHPKFLFPADGRDHRLGRHLNQKDADAKPIPMASRSKTPMSVTAIQGAMPPRHSAASTFDNRISGSRRPNSSGSVSVKGRTGSGSRLQPANTSIRIQGVQDRSDIRVSLLRRITLAITRLARVTW